MESIILETKIHAMFLKSTFLFSTLLCLCTFSTGNGQDADYAVKPVAFTDVIFEDGFWKKRLETVTKVTIPYTLSKCEETGRIDNFKFAGGLEEGSFRTRHGFDDSDLYKILEGASYSLQISPDPNLEAYLDTIISYIDAAQEDDGYLYTAWTLKANENADLLCCSYAEEGQFINSRWSHELYNVGHMYEAAAAHFQATGRRNFLDIATRNADLIYKICIEENKPFYPGHQEIEIGLVKLYRITGNRNYLDLALEFLERRGKGLTSYTNEGHELINYDIYSQDHKPVAEQDEAVGHAVRAVYMYAAMADIAAISRKNEYAEALDKLWNNIVAKKMYITGGLGAGNGIEGFDVAYALPNDAYAETCAAIANVYWNHRMFLLHGDAKYLDVLERTLYNGLISGLSLDGDVFFYPNPLVFDGKETFNQGAVCRKEWFNCSCCPSNLSRFIPSVGGYAYATSGKSIYVNLFMNSTTNISLNGAHIKIRQEGNYPWDGSISLGFEQEPPVTADVHIRIPGWSRNEAVPSDLYTTLKKIEPGLSIHVNGDEATYRMEKGFAILSGSWKKGDIITVSLPMPVRFIRSHPEIESNQAKVAVQRGPIVYCAEGIDNQGYAEEIMLTGNEELIPVYRPEFLDGINTLQGLAKAPLNGQYVRKPIQLVPYYSWSHRDVSPMAVWLKHDAGSE